MDKLDKMINCLEEQGSGFKAKGESQKAKGFSQLQLRLRVER